MMSRTHYQKIAKALAVVRFDAWSRDVRDVVREVLDDVQSELADVFQEDNDRFDRPRFYDAANTNPHE